MEKEELLERVYKRNRRYVNIGLGLALFNITVYTFLMQERAALWECAIVSMNFWFWLVAFGGSVFGLLFAFLPYKGLRYGEKYLRAALLSMLVLEWMGVALCTISAIYKWGFGFPI